MTPPPNHLCSAALTGNGYWTCDVVGGCRDCRLLARAIGDTETLDGWKDEKRYNEAELGKWVTS